MRYHRPALLIALLITGCAQYLQANAFPPVKKLPVASQQLAVRQLAVTSYPLGGHRQFSINPQRPYDSRLTVHVLDSADLFPDFMSFNLTTCLPQTVQFIDNSIALNDAVVQEWLWDFGDGGTGRDQEPVHDYTQNGTYTVTLTIKDTSGGVASFSQQIVINTPTPVVSLGNDTSVCVGTTVTLNAGLQPGCSYIWSTGETAQTIQVDTTGDYWVQVYNGTCASSAFVHVEVAPKLLSAFTSAQQGTCLPVGVQFTDQSTACGASVISYKWEFGDGDSSTLQHPVHVYTEAKAYTVKLTVRSSTGRVATSMQTISINVNTPFVNLGNDTTICVGNTLTLDADTLGQSFLWSNGATSQTIPVTSAGIYWVRVSKDGCSGWDSIVVKTTFPLVANFNATVTSQCLPVTVAFKDSSNVICGSLAITKWLWDFGDGNTSALQHPDHIYTKAGKFTVQLTVWNSANMSTSKSREVNVVTVGPVNAASPDVTICQGDSIQLHAGNEGSVYAWTPATSLNNNIIQEPMAAPRATTLFIASISKCGVTIRDSVMVYVDSMPKPVISKPDGGTLASSQAASYKWYKDDVLIQGATNKTYRPSVMGNYQVGVTNARGCSNLSAKYFFLPGEAPALPGTQAKIKVTPNPSHGMVDIILSKAPQKPIQVEIYNVFGKKVYAGYISNNVNSINLGYLHKGLHFVKLFLNEGKVVLPLQLL